jgi:hypothetical protein
MFPHIPNRPAGGPHPGIAISPRDATFPGQSLSVRVALTVTGSLISAPSTDLTSTVKVSAGSFTLSPACPFPIVSVGVDHQTVPERLGQRASSGSDARIGADAARRKVNW